MAKVVQWMGLEVFLLALLSHLCPKTYGKGAGVGGGTLRENRPGVHYYGLPQEPGVTLVQTV